MKKKIVVLLFSTMFLGLIACGKNDENEKIETDTEMSRDNSIEETETEDVEAETESEAESETKSEEDLSSQDKDSNDEKKKDFQEVADLIRKSQDYADKTHARMSVEDLTQYDYNTLSGNMYGTWDNTLNQVWECIKTNISEEEYNKLLEEQRDWIAERDKQIEDAGKEAEGGTMQPMLENDMGFELTRSRTCELAAVLGPDFSYQLVKSFGLKDGESNLSFSTADDAIIDEGDYYLVEITVSRSVKVSDKIQDGGYYAFYLDELNNTIENVQYNGEDLVSEDETIYYYTPNGTDELVELYFFSDDRVDAVFYKGYFKVSKNVIFRTDITNKEKNLEKKDLVNNYFNGAVFDDNGVITKMIFYGD